MGAALPPKVETALLWELLDYAVSAAPTVDTDDSSDNVELNVNTQFLLPINAETLLPVSVSNHLQSFSEAELWDQTTFEFDMAEYANIPEMSTLMPNEPWITGHL